MRWEQAEVRARAKETPEGRKAAGRKGGVWGPGRRWGHTCNAVKGGRFLYVFGGYGKDNCQTNDVHVFDTARKTWSKPMMKGVPPSPRDSHTCTTVGNELYVFGGTDGSNPLNDLYVLDTSSNTWISPFISGNGPDAREGHSAALVGKKLYIFGGCGRSRDNPEEIYYNDLFILDTEERTWDRPLTSGLPPSARDSHTCSSWGNQLIVLGGEDASDFYLADVFILDTETLLWTQLNTSGHMLAPRAGHCTVALGRNLFVFGGFTDDRNLYDDLHVLNVETGMWSKVFTLNSGPSARFSAAGDCLDAQSGILVFIGGCNATLEALDDMYYLFTDMPHVNGKSQRPEKLSLKRELKMKVQECHLSARTLTSSRGSSPLGVPPFSSGDGVQRNAGVPDFVGKPFEAIITSIQNDSCTLETTIDGRKLRGLVFSPGRGFNLSSARPVDMRRIKIDDGDAEMDDSNQFEALPRNSVEIKIENSSQMIICEDHENIASIETSRGSPLLERTTPLSISEPKEVALPVEKDHPDGEPPPAHPTDV